MSSTPILVALGLAASLAACGKDGEAVVNGPQGRLTIAAKALTYDPIVDADYTIAVYNDEGELVWTKSGITSQDYGDSRGAIAYVGPCDAASSPNRVELTVASLSDEGGPLGPGEWTNPTATGPLVQSVPCAPNADTPVEFNLTIMRPAQQGFTDIGVQFSDIFCSAKADCQETFLHHPETGQRAATVVLALACTAGPDGETWLHYDDIFVRCDDGPHRIFPSRKPGNGPGDPDAIYGTGYYRGREGLPDYDKCYWNVAIGVELGPDAKNCRLEAYATASDFSFADNAMATPDNTAYPYIGYVLDITDGSGQFVCTSHPLDGSPGGVATGYTELGGRDFKHEWECSEDPAIVTQKRECDGTALGATDAAAFVQNPGGVRLEIGDEEVSPSYLLAPGLRVGGCCANPCPDCVDTPMR
ncbi:MAG: hypothetical protein IT385_20275 [Deltaproteobacteria bacterium]|nr:hypothetical protein [Deltaproteobacteria bacterium]